MMARGHLLSGLAAGMLTAPLVPWTHSLLGGSIWLAACTYAGLVPDLDMPGAKLSRTLGPITWVIALGFQALAVVAFELTRTDKDPLECDGHRGLTHTLVFPPALGLALYGLLRAFTVPHWLAAEISTAVVVGSLAHIAGDCCTVSGCPLFWPFVVDGRRWYRAGIPRLLRFKTGYRHDDPEDTWWEVIGERTITALLYVACFVLAVGSYLPGGWPGVFSAISRGLGWASNGLVVP